jgi:hypothetical protein
MGEENILSSEDGKDEQEPPNDHEKNQNGEDNSKHKRKRGMDIPQPHYRDIPEKKDEKKEDQTGKNQ